MKYGACFSTARRRATTSRVRMGTRFRPVFCQDFDSRFPSVEEKTDRFRIQVRVLYAELSDIDGLKGT